MRAFLLAAILLACIGCGRYTIDEAVAEIKAIPEVADVTCVEFYDSVEMNVYLHEYNRYNSEKVCKETSWYLMRIEGKTRGAANFLQYTGEKGGE